MAYLAHVLLGKDGSIDKEQTVEVHARNCAQYASQKVMSGLAQTAYLTALLHDMGKYTEAFQDYLKRASRGEPVRRGSVNHTFAAVRFCLERRNQAEGLSLRNMVCEIIAAAAGGHHGLFDCFDLDGNSGFAHRLNKKNIGYEEALPHYLIYCAGQDELDRLFAAAEKELSLAVEEIASHAGSKQEFRFYLSCLVRLLLSAVIDADRRDTAEFMCGMAHPTQPNEMTATWAACLCTVENKLNQMPQNLPIDSIRRNISNECLAAVSRGRGLYRLSVPTGGGKTLAGLRYALAAAMQNQQQRIFFVIPLLSVLEQNAAVLRNTLEDTSLVLEHHSNIIREKAPTEQLDKNELLMETWDAPIVITTLVQFLNTLFAGKNSCVRRMQALCNSVIVLDEVQSVPSKMLSLFNLAINFLTTVCRCTVVLCSATQPCLDSIRHPILYSDPADLIARDEASWRVFRRTQIIDKRKPGGYTIDELAFFALERMQEEDSLLVICNTKRQALHLYAILKERSDAQVLHLSTSMCMAHRICAFEQINSALKNKERLICVSTQLVEAGVDFSFACAIRVLAGLDNAIQSAGRVNRSGEFEKICYLYLVNIHQEDLSFLEEIKEAKKATESVLLTFKENPETYGNDLASEAAVSAYYRRLYTDAKANAHDYPLCKQDVTLFSLLSDNKSGFRCEGYRNYTITQAFKTAGEAFSVFDTDTVDILVPYQKGAELIAELHSNQSIWNLNHRKAVLQQCKPYTISLYHYEIKQLQEAGGLNSLFEDSVWALQPGCYSLKTGLDLSCNSNPYLEVQDDTSEQC